MSRKHNSRKIHTLLIANKSLENMAKLKYFEMRVTNKNWILRLNSGNVRYYSVENICPPVLSKYGNI